MTAQPPSPHRVAYAAHATAAGWLAVGTLTVAAWMSRHDDPSTALVLDNAAWTLAFMLAALTLTRSYYQATPHDRAQRVLRAALAAGTVLLFVGQCVWNVQVAIEDDPFPSVADGVFLTAAVVWCAGWAWLLLRPAGGDAAEVTDVVPVRRVTALDVAAFLSAWLAVVLTVYLPQRGDVSALELGVLVAYPVLFLFAAGLAFFAALVQQVHLAWPYVQVITGIALFGISWMHWNLLALQEALQPGSWHHGSYSLAAWLLARGGSRCTVLPIAPTIARWRRVALNYLPIGAVLLAVLALLAQFVYSDAASEFGQQLIFACSIVALIFTSLRQALLLSILERLRAAERAILRNEAALFRLANYDSLTGLPNRRMFEERLSAALRDASTMRGRVAVMLADIDHFQQINDALGHAYGDTLLCTVAAHWRQELPPQVTLARMGGDEFLLMVQQVQSRTDVAALAQQLLDALPPLMLTQSGRTSHALSATVGISLYPDDAQDVAALIRNADTALHQAKSAARGTYRFYLAEYTQATQRKLYLRARLRLAVQHKELSVVYQPQFDASRTVVGMEALLRWQLDGEAVSPEEFIPIAEDDGSILSIGDWVLETVCHQVACWRATGFVVPVVSVNISARQLLDAQLPERLTDVVRRHGLTPNDILLEVTESQWVDDRMHACTKRLHALGFGLSVDDFGTGQSSMLKLKRLPARELKIDKAFVRDIVDDADDRQICSTILALAVVLGMDAVAEGVESQAQLETLMAMGCRRFQGWLFAPAMPPAELEREVLATCHVGVPVQSASS